MKNKFFKQFNEELKKIKKGLIVGTAVLYFATIYSGIPEIDNNVAIVEAKAKKDTKKPTIKLAGNTDITTTKNEKITIPKTTAKDNKDGNVTKKIKVTVKKGKKRYSSIAKNIKNNKAVKFTSIGKYTITYTVTDKAGNKATKKRYVTVKSPAVSTTESKTTESPTTELRTEVTAEATTESRTEVTTEATTESRTEVTAEATTESRTEATTEKPATTETPEIEQPTYNINLSDYIDYEVVNINGIEYKLATNEDLQFSQYNKGEKDKVEIKYANLHQNYKIQNIYCGVDKKSPYIGDEFLLFKIAGEITLKYDGMDISDDVFIHKDEASNENVIWYNICFITPDGRFIKVTSVQTLYKNWKDLLVLFKDWLALPNDSIFENEEKGVMFCPSSIENYVEIDGQKLTLNMIEK